MQTALAEPFNYSEKVHPCIFAPSWDFCILARPLKVTHRSRRTRLSGLFLLLGDGSGCSYSAGRACEDGGPGPPDLTVTLC